MSSGTSTNGQIADGWKYESEIPTGRITTWWLIPLSKWVITPVINGISRVNPLITGVITHLLSGMSHQVSTSTWRYPNSAWNSAGRSTRPQGSRKKPPPIQGRFRKVHGRLRKSGLTWCPNRSQPFLSRDSQRSGEVPRWQCQHSITGTMWGPRSIAWTVGA